MSKFWASSDSSSEEETEDQQSHNDKEEEEEDISSPALRHQLAQDPTTCWARIGPQQHFSSVPQVSAAEGRRSDCTRIVCMSDTHGLHRSISVPSGDILVHGGDFSKSGEPGTIRDLGDYFGGLKGFQKIIVIAGNHDLTFQPEHYETVWKGFHRAPFDALETQALLTNCHYLQDSSCQIKGDIKVYGSPWQPFFYNWAFNLHRGDPIRRVWEQIPNDTDVLITHGPPLGRGDTCSNAGGKFVVGCFDLLQEIQDRVRPRLHVFGHVHEGYGTSFDGTTLYVNASNLTFLYKPLNGCIVIDLPHDKTKPAMVVKPLCRIRTMEDMDEWLRKSEFKALHANFLDSAATTSFPLGDDLLGESAYSNVCNALHAHRDRSAQDEVVRFLSKIHSESFDY